MAHGWNRLARNPLGAVSSLAWLPLRTGAEVVAGLALYLVLGALDVVDISSSPAGLFTPVTSTPSLAHPGAAGNSTVTRSSPPPPTPVPTPRLLSAADRLLVLGSLASTFKSCAAKTDPAPVGCPQILSATTPTSVATWQLVGDPLGDAQVALSDPLGPGDLVTASGHHQMLASYFDSQLNALRHVALASGYRAALRRAGDGFQLTTLVSAADVPSASRPVGASDDVVKDSVRQAFTRCAGAHALSVVDCPMKLTTDNNIQNVVWRLLGDPLAQAVVNFDPSIGAFQVTGTYSMLADYDAIALISFHHSDPSSGGFRTLVLWDGSNGVVGGIDRVP